MASTTRQDAESAERHLEPESRTHEEVALFVNEERLRLATEHAEIGFWDVDPVHDQLIWPPRVKAMFGISADEPVSMADFYAGLHPEDRDATTAAFAAATNPEVRALYDVEYRTVGKEDGVLRWVAAKGRGLFDAEGKCVRVVGTAVDISARKLGEAALAESEARFRNVADHAPMIMWVTDPSGRCTYLNKAWYEFTGQTERDAEGFGWLDATHPDDRTDTETVFLAANERREPFRLEYRLRRADGAYRWAIDAAAPRFGPGGEFLGYVGSVIDIDARREMEEALRESERRYRTLFESIESGFCVVEVRLDEQIDYRVIEANPAFYKQTGFPEAILGCWLREAAPELEEHWYEMYASVARSGEPQRFEQGSELLGRWFDVCAFAIDAPTDRRVAILFNDISARRNAEEQLRQLNETLEQEVALALAERKLLADIVEGTDAFVQVADLDFRWLAINAAAANEFERIFGVRPTVGQSMLDVLNDHPEHCEAVRAVWGRALAGEEFTEVGEFGDHERDRRHYEMKYNVLRDVNGERVGAYQFVYDVTQRVTEQRRLREAEEALLHAQKMEAMGSLTGGVAHDFNNLLTPIVGTLDLLQRKGVGGDREQRLIGAASEAAQRARTLVQRLLAFARRQPLQPVAVDIAKLVEGMAELVSSTTGPQIKVIMDVAGELPSAMADVNQLEMALLNLAVNARDAMPSGGTLRISAAAEIIGPNSRHGLKPGTYVRLSVADTGFGMDEATAARAIEPFFSTKGVGHGTGLGLSMAHGLASQLGGALAIHSRPGLGTNIELWLPQSAETPQAMTAHDAEPTPSARALVLLVDDEDLVRMITADMLGEMGYVVVEAENAERALRLVEDGLRPDILVTDHLMPGMSGVDLARTLRTNRPDLPVLVISGYADSQDLAPELPRLAKPFVDAELAASLSAIAAGTR